MALAALQSVKNGFTKKNLITTLIVIAIGIYAAVITGAANANKVQMIMAAIGCVIVTMILLMYRADMFSSAEDSEDDDGFQFADKMTAAPAVDPAVQAVAEAIDVLAEPVAMFDAQDKFVFCNEAYATLFPNCTAMLNSGVPYDRLVRAQIDAGYIAAAKGDTDGWLTGHMAGRRSLPRSEPFAGPDGRNYQVRDYRATNGGVVTIYTEAAAAGGQGLGDNQGSPEVAQLKTMLQSKAEALTQAERKLEAAEAEAAQARRATTAAAPAAAPAAATEALRAPLNGIIGYADIIQSEIYGELGDPRYREYAEQITANAQEMLTVVGDGQDAGAGPSLAPDPPAPTRPAVPGPSAAGETKLDAAALASQIRDMMATQDGGAPTQPAPAPAPTAAPTPRPQVRAPRPRTETAAPAASGEEQNVMDQWKKLTGGDA